MRTTNTGRSICLAAALLPAWACSDGPSDVNAGADEKSTLREQHAGHMDGGARHAQCGQPYAKDPRDDTMTGELVRVVTILAVALGRERA